MSNPTKSTMKKYFEEYDKAGPVPASLDDKRIEGILNGTSREPMPAKIDALCNVVASVEASINQNRRNNTSNIVSVEIAKNFTISSNPNDPECLPHVNLVPVGNSNSIANVSLNVNVQKLLKLPAERVYSIVYALVESSVFDKVLDKNTASDENERYKEDKELYRDVEEFEKANGKDLKKDQTLFQRIINYIKSGLKQLFGDNYPEDKLESISQEIAGNYSSAYGGTDVVYEEMFDTSHLKGDPSVADLKQARISKLVSKADLAAAADSPREEMSYRQQASALLSEEIKESYKQMDITGGEAQKKNFCISYIQQMLASNGVDPDSLVISFDTFNSKGNALPQGTYYDGQPKRINVNLGKAKDITDLVMTLTHETTHALDAIHNSENGIQNASGGGLVGVARGVNFGDIGMKPGSKGFTLLSYLNSLAYHIDPNERRGRIGELAGLQFMSQMSGDSATTRQVEKNIAGFKKYQQKTIDMIAGLNEPGGKFSLESLKSQYAAIANDLPENVRQAFIEKFDYIEQVLSLGLDSSQEMESLRNVQNIAREMAGQAPVNEEDLQMQ